MIYVYAGTINVTSTILVKVNKDPEETVAQTSLSLLKRRKIKTDRNIINKMKNGMYGS